MKRLTAFIGIALILIGLRFYDSGLARLTEGETISVFNGSYQRELFVPTGADCYRIDLKGAENVDKLLSLSFAVIRFTEMDGQLIYAYSDRIPRAEWIHGQKVNIMIYSQGDRVCAGVPVLKGSY